MERDFFVRTLTLFVLIYRPVIAACPLIDCTWKACKTVIFLVKLENLGYKITRFEIPAKK